MKVGDNLYCLDGTVAVLRAIEGNTIVVEYNGALHRRPSSVINQKLFLEPIALNYDESGYDQFGFNRAGFDRAGYRRSGYNRAGYDRLGYNRSGFDRDGFNRAGFDEDGFDRTGYNQEGYDRDGFNRAGFDKDGFDRTGYSQEGYDRDGYDRNGYDRGGYDKDGYNHDGLDYEGYNREGYNREGYDREGYDRQGYNRQRYDRDGYSPMGYNRQGFNREGYDRQGYDKNGFDREGIYRNDYDRREPAHTEVKTVVPAKSQQRSRKRVNLCSSSRPDVYQNAEHTCRKKKAAVLPDSYQSEPCGDNLCFVPGAKVYVRYGDKWEDGEFIQYGSDQSGERTVYVKCHGRTICYADTMQMVSLYPPEKTEKEKSRIGKFSAREIAAYVSRKFPKAKEPALDETTENAVEQQYFGSVLKELYRLTAVQDARANELEEKQGQTYWDIRDAYIADREAGGYDPFNQIAISVNSSLENCDRNLALVKQIKQKLRRQSEEPYFARIDCGPSLSDVHTVYIGDAEIPNFVTDWRDTRVGNLYYNTALYRNQKEMAIVLKRHFHIKEGVLSGFTDEIRNYGYLDQTQGSEPNITADPLLLRILEAHRSDQKVSDIIQTIQGNQYDIITSDFGKNMLVNGCAGSGKTMILYHRLSFMAFNMPNFNPENVYVITPSKLFETLMIELMEKLDLVKIHNLTYEQTTLNLLQQYCDICGLSGFNVLTCYSEKLEINKIYELLFDEFYNNSEMCDAQPGTDPKLLRWLAHHLVQVFHEAHIDGLQENEILQYLNGTSHERTALQERVTGYSEDQLQRIFSNTLEEIRYRISDPKSEKKSRKRKENLESVDAQLLNEVFSHRRRLSASGTANKKEGKVDEILEHHSAFQRAVAVQYVKKMLEAMESKEHKYALVCRYCLDTLKATHGLNANVNYGFEYRFFLRAFSKHFGALSSDAVWIFLDEFQNYSQEELICLRQVFPSAVFNFFGDFDQRLDEKGISDHLMAELFDVSKFEIHENYRNAFEITEFINRNLRKTMIPIGLHGQVSQSPIQSNKFKVSGRTAFIAKDITEQLLATLGKNIHIVVERNETLEVDKLNVMDVRLAKGLEFDTVYVFDRDMTENEKYVAYTRALDRLIILSDG